jgi:hypothetical protein
MKLKSEQATVATRPWAWLKSRSTTTGGGATTTAHRPVQRGACNRCCGETKPCCLFHVLEFKSDCFEITYPEVAGMPAISKRSGVFSRKLEGSRLVVTNTPVLSAHAVAWPELAPIPFLREVAKASSGQIPLPFWISDRKNCYKCNRESVISYQIGRLFFCYSVKAVIISMNS